ncbi:MAG: hypothetical protein ACQ5SW_03370 [Sphaerochaetaceae bacterium]
MLTTSAAFQQQIQSDALRVLPRVRWWRSWNHLKEPTVSLALNTSVDTELFPVDSVLNNQHQESSGSAYAITGEGRTSTDPRYGYRTAPADSEINPILQLSDRTDGTSGTTPMSRIDVDYDEELDANVIEVQLETLRQSTGNFHAVKLEVFRRSTADTWVSIWDGTISGSSEGRLVLYWNGSTWSDTEDDYEETLVLKGVRIDIKDTTVAAWNPKIRYVGAHHVMDVSDDVVNFDVTKSESEQLSYMPFGNPVANSGNIVLDNTHQEYAFKPVGEEQPPYDLNMRLDIALGLDLDFNGGPGSGIEYVELGTYYTDGLAYSTDMELDIPFTDRSKFMQRKFLDDVFYEDASYKFMVKDLLARTGFDAAAANFNLGVTKVANESRTVPYAWYKSDALLWDALSDVVRSELGTFFIQEDNTYLFTDREFLQSKVDEGTQWTIDAGVDLERAGQEFTVDANEVEVSWTKTGKNIDERGIINVGYQLDENGDLEVDYTSTGPIEISSVLWEPGETLAINAATIYESMNSSQMYVRLDRPLGDTFPEEGIINIEGEYMLYDGKEIENDYIELTITERGARGTTAAAHRNGAADKTATDSEMFSYYTHDVADAPVVTTTVEDGQYVVEQDCPEDPYNTFTAFRPFGAEVNSGDYAYGMRFKFEDKGNANNMAGMFVHAKTSSWGGDKTVFDTYWIEIVSTDQLAQEGYDITGSVRVYRTSDKHTVDERNGLPPTNENAIFGHDGPIMSDGVPVNIDVYWDSSAELFSLYINDVFMTSWQASYTDGELEHPLAQASAHKDNYHDANLTGYFGFYVRGDTKISVEYYYAGDIDRDDEQYVADYIYGGFASQQYLRKQEAEHFIEYGSIAHELRQFEIEHQVWPNRWVRIFNSNEYEARVINEEHNSFRSKFEVINISRTPAILVGNDSSPYNNGLGANHQFFVYGSSVIELETGEKVARDKSAIRKRGISNVRVENPWVSSEKHAQSIANWVTENWAEPVDFYDIDWFPMFAIQPGDAVEIDYEEKGF